AIAALKFYYKKVLNRTFQVERLRTQKKLFPVLSIGEVERLFDSAKNEKHMMLLKFLYYTGARLSEVINLKCSDIDFERNQIHIKSGKGRKDRFITINPEYEAELKKYVSTYEQESYVFSTLKGKYSKRSVQKICSTYAKKAEISKNITPHTLRRTFATHLIEKNIHIYKISKLMGHASTNTTEGYISYAKIPLTASL
ncbi:MAG: tyrosine-type recombinase/integrase, partial [archaeon]